jgi:hypothetical protein
MQVCISSPNNDSLIKTSCRPGSSCRTGILFGPPKFCVSRNISKTIAERPQAANAFGTRNFRYALALGKNGGINADYAVHENPKTLLVSNPDMVRSSAPLSALAGGT